MKDIKQFIEKAIEGGWNIKLQGLKCSIRGYYDNERFNIIEKTDDINEGIFLSYSIEEIVLDPKAWKAVGKVEGWETPEN